MLEEKTTQIILDEYFSGCVKYWQKQQGISESEAYKRALEYDMIEIYKVNGGCLHDPNSPRGEELDRQTVLDFFKYRCMDVYGKAWELQWNSYKLNC